jgi:hypothetical protein
LNHSANGDVTAIYDRYGRDHEMAEAMAKWNTRLKQIVAGMVAIEDGR